jgi:hypothetical protein
MRLFIITFLSLINLMINKYTSDIIVLHCWNTAAYKYPGETESASHCNKG